MKDWPKLLLTILEILLKTSQMGIQDQMDQLLFKEYNDIAKKVKEA